MAWVAIGIGGATALANILGQAQREKSQKALAAKTAEFSPWTGLKPGEIQYANPAGALASGAAVGLGVHQGLSNGGAPGAGQAATGGPSPGSSMVAQENASIGNPQFGLGPKNMTNPWAGNVFRNPYEEQYSLLNPMAGTTPGS